MATRNAMTVLPISDRDSHGWAYPDARRTLELYAGCGLLPAVSRPGLGTLSTVDGALFICA